MKLKIYQVDAFATKVFEGNPAAVCPLDYWLSDEILQKIAEENNLSETAFFVILDECIELRWFTPLKEVDLCGHATLATAHVLYEYLQYAKNQIIFETKSGSLKVSKAESGYIMDFPSSIPQVISDDVPMGLIDAIGDIKPKIILSAFDYILVLNTEEEVINLCPDLSKWLSINLRGVIVTAKGKNVDFVSRCFFPKLRVNEDPVTGSAHCELAPYWASVYGKNVLTARQLSKRSGEMTCEVLDDRVYLSGSAVGYMVGEITI